MYLVLRPIQNKKTAYVSDVPNNTSGTWTAATNDGEAITGKVPPLQVRTSDDYGDDLPDVVANALADLIVSQPFLDVLDAIGVKNYQKFPLTVQHHADRKKYNYWICNVLGTIPCLDRRKAKVQWHPRDKNKVFVMNKLAIDPKLIAAHNQALKDGDRLRLFRLQEARHFIIADEGIRDAVVKAGVTGVEFKKPEECSD